MTGKHYTSPELEPVRGRVDSVIGLILATIKFSGRLCRIDNFYKNRFAIGSFYNLQPVGGRLSLFLQVI